MVGVFLNQFDNLPINNSNILPSSVAVRLPTCNDRVGLTVVGLGLTASGGVAAGSVQEQVTQRVEVDRTTASPQAGKPAVATRHVTVVRNGCHRHAGDRMELPETVKLLRRYRASTVLQ